jgi:hypothetical protein
LLILFGKRILNCYAVSSDVKLTINIRNGGMRMYVDHIKEITGWKSIVPVRLKCYEAGAGRPGTGWQGWVMRLFTIGNEGYSPRHAHPGPISTILSAGRELCSWMGRSTR